MIRLLAAVAGVLLVVGAAACGGRVDRGAYVQANERLFAQLPSFPGSRRFGETSTAYRASESGPVVGYGTRFELRLPATATADDAAAFFRRRLRPRWRLVEEIDGPVLNFRRGDGFVSVNLDNAGIHIFEIAVDSAYYGKAGR